MKNRLLSIILMLLFVMDVDNMMPVMGLVGVNENDVNHQLENIRFKMLMEKTIMDVECQQKVL